MVKMRWFLFLIMSLLVTSLQAASIVATLDRNPVALGDAVTLTFTVEGMVASEPDFSPLEQNFDIAGRSQSNSFSFQNGVSSMRTQWNLTLYPKQAGKLTIPSIAFGSDKSQSLDLQVTEQPASSSGKTEDVLVELTTLPEQPYVQQQTVVIQRLYHVVALNSSTLSHPEVEAGKGNIQQIGKVRHLTKLRNGRSYNVVERRYLLTPQQSGELTLGRTRFDGIVADTASKRGFDPFGLSGKRVRRVSKPVTLQVLPQAANYQGKYWLPAKSLTLNADWQMAADSLQTGEPITLTLAIMADGLAAEQLPALDVNMPVGLKAYTAQPESRNTINADGVVGVRQEKWVIVSPYDGEFVLPEIQLSWWNITENRQEVARIEPTTMVFSGGQAAPANTLPPQVTSPPPQTEPVAEQESEFQAEADNAANDEGWSWTDIASGFLVLWIVLTVLWLARQLWLRMVEGKASVVPTTPRPLAAVSRLNENRSLLQRLQQACEQNQAQAAYDALLVWMEKIADIQPAVLTNLRAQAPEKLQQEIDRLNNALYGRSETAWQGQALWLALQEYQVPSDSHKNDAELLPLYPD